MMDRNVQGAFVLSWAQTEIDGMTGTRVDALMTGMLWRRTGEAVRIDGHGDLSAADAGRDDLRVRAARTVRKMLRAVATDARRLDGIEVGAPLRERGFAVTDGRRVWAATVIGTLPDRPPLVMFLGDPPPADTDLWVVSRDIDLAPRRPGAARAGGIVCFTPGTMILCEGGPRPVEDLSPGMRIQTKDSGCAELLWIGHRRITGARLCVEPDLAPVLLRAGALDRAVPDSDLLVSPDHRILLRGRRARALFNADEVLVAARDLVDGGPVSFARRLREVAYIHLLLPRHEIVFANGVETESFHPADAAPDLIAPDQRDSLMAHLPGGRDIAAYGQHARRVLGPGDAAILRGAA